MALASFKTYLIAADQYYDMTAQRERWVLRHAIDQADWDADPWGATMPAKYAATPTAGDAYPARLGVEGICLRRKVLFREMPGYVIIDLTYGWDPTITADNSAYITMRTILVEQDFDWSLDDPQKQMTGRVYIADKPTLRVYGVKGGTQRILIPYQVIRIYALLDETGRTAYAKPLVHKAVNVNDAQWIFGGMTFATKTLMFRGVTLDYSRRWGTSATHRIYNTIFEFIERPIAWPLNVNRYEWEEVVKQADIVDNDKQVVGQTKIGALAPVSATETACIIRTAYAFDDILGSSTIGSKLIS